MPLKTLLVFGTRPEAIKMAPVVRACQEHPDIEPITCSTGQHREMLRQVTQYFGITEDVDLDLMQPDQTLSEFTARSLTALDEAVKRTAAECVVAQGDTTSVMTAALVAFYHRLPFVHVEAGLRTYDLQSPWPEELNRRLAGMVAALHCAPTRRAADNLLREGAAERSVHVTGNTVIDALLWTLEHEQQREAYWEDKYHMLGDRRLVLITGHRRENFGNGFQNICSAIARLSERFGDTEFLYPVHLNPNVRRTVFQRLQGRPNVHLVEPAWYPEFVWLMHRSRIILSDSGGVQEEAPSLKKPVLVLRDTTERPEALDSGAVELVGTDEDLIVERASALLESDDEYRRHQTDKNPYGDGHAARRIAELISRQVWN